MPDPTRTRHVLDSFAVVGRAWREGWVALSAPLVRALLVLVLGVAALGTLVLGAQLGSADALSLVSDVAVPLVSVGAGVLLVVAARHRRGREMAAWVLLGAGVGCWGIGEAIWTWYIVFRPGAVPYPGLADLLYVAGYPVLFAGVLFLPHLHAGRWERVRITLDVVAGTIALTAIMWTFYLRDAIEISASASLLENAVNLAYPVGDLVLLIGLIIIFTRRSDLQFDGRLLVIGAGMALTVAADVTYVVLLNNGSYVDGAAMDAMWVGGYGLFALAGLFVASSPRIRDQIDRSNRLGAILAPYGIVAALFVVTLAESGGRATILQGSTAVVGLVIIVRQGVGIRETRQVVEKQRNDMVASISHELRTPLTAISGFMDILDASPDLDPVERAEIVTIVASQSKHLATIVGDLVGVARDDLRTIGLKHDEIDVAGVVGTAIETLGAEAASVRLTTHIEPGLSIRGDRGRLCQVLVNYLTNALRYGNGVVEVCGRKTGHEVTLEVHDNGPGIPRKFDLSIWERFERGAQTYLSDTPGSGLGLTIARQLVSAHGGRSGHHPSERLGGACFWMALPIAKLRPATEGSLAAAHSV